MSIFADKTIKWAFLEFFFVYSIYEQSLIISKSINSACVFPYADNCDWLKFISKPKGSLRF